MYWQLAASWNIVANLKHRQSVWCFASIYQLKIVEMKKYSAITHLKLKRVPIIFYFYLVDLELC